MKGLASLSVVTTVAILAACGGAITPDDATGVACVKYSDALLQARARCQPDSPSSPADRSTYLAVCQAGVAAPGTSFTDAYLSACADAIATSTTCRFDTLPACRSLPGKLATGTPCLMDVQCQSGACDTTGNTSADAGAATGLRCGTCAARAVENAACDWNGVSALPCMLGLDCIAGTCKQPVTIPSGGACSFSGPPGSHCVDGTVCDLDGSSTCVPTPKKGDRCLSTCDTHLACVAGACQDAVGLGGACPTGSECATSLICNATTKTCAAFEIGQMGDACGSAIGVTCDAGLSCKPVVNGGICAVLKKLGTACVASEDDCAVFLHCVSGSCQAPDAALCK